MLCEYSFDNIYIRHAVDDFPNDKDFTMHIHEQCEIYFLVAGDVTYLVEGSEYPLRENSLMIMRPSEAHKPKITACGRYERYAVNFPLTFADSIDPERRLFIPFTERQLGKDNMFCPTDVDTALVHRLFKEMCENNSDYNRRLTVNTHLLMLLDTISRAFFTKGSTEHTPKSTAERIVIYVNEHLFEEITIPSLAGHFYLSPSQFTRIFRKATGAAPWEYITQKRLTAAKSIIRSGSSAQHAAESCGFKDYSVFYKAYIGHFGCAPTHDN
ncbi:MAG: helix-turn-helix transcriptional regulator [Oscillospiraceae bacterium]|nr:helix-turn-helix transcriptional regulator [Oscillospiraceae bacterium]